MYYLSLSLSPSIFFCLAACGVSVVTMVELSIETIQIDDHLFCKSLSVCLDERPSESAEPRRSSVLEMRSILLGCAMRFGRLRYVGEGGLRGLCGCAAELSGAEVVNRLIR